MIIVRMSQRWRIPFVMLAKTLATFTAPYFLFWRTLYAFPCFPLKTLGFRLLTRLRANAVRRYGRATNVYRHHWWRTLFAATGGQPTACWPGRAA